ncbi:MAG: carboxypeptidase-like regulatory domain-containing protein, partial [Tepidisphaeraceae bacterium]
GYARWWSDDATQRWERKQVEPGKFQRNFDHLTFQIERGIRPVTVEVEKAVTITGKVLDPDEKPVAGATVAPAKTGSGNSLTGDTRFSVTSKQDGTFTMTLPASGPTPYNLVVHDGKYQQWRTWANGVNEPFMAQPGETISDVTMRLTRPAVVRGRVVDAAGKPVADRDVRTHAADKRENRYYDPTTRTDQDGKFELKFVRGGEQYVQVAPFWLAAEEAPAGLWVKLTLKEGEMKEDVELTAAAERN